MIIQVAGTSGAGKSYLMRQFMACALQQTRLGDPAKPSGYDLRFRGVADPVHVVGSYETVGTTVGCDTIRDVVKLYDLILEQRGLGKHVVFEGLFVMNQTRGPQLAQDYTDEVVVLQLTTPLATCIASIDKRREARGVGPLATLDNTKGNYVRAQNYCMRMREAGARVYKVTRGEALPKLLGVLHG